MLPIKWQWLLTAVCLLVVPRVHAQQDNVLSPAERSDGWQLLFDGNTTSGWHSYGMGMVGGAWNVDAGSLHYNSVAGQGDLLTNSVYTEFDLKLDYKITSRSNTGVLFHVKEYPRVTAESTGPEVQLIDNGNPAAANPLWRTGSLGGLIAADPNVGAPTGAWNHLEVYAKDGVFKIIQNGSTVVSFVVTANSWKQLIANSQFRSVQGFGIYYTGAFGLQNGGGEAWFKNIRIKAFSPHATSNATVANLANRYYRVTPGAPVPTAALNRVALPRSTAQTNQTSAQPMGTPAGATQPPQQVQGSGQSGQQSQSSTSSSTRTGSQNAGLSTHSFSVVLPPTGDFDQQHLPVSALEDWEKGVQAAAAGQYQESMEDFERSAAQGNADAGFELGCYATASEYFQHDQALAAKWFRFALHNGNLLAAEKLSTMISVNEIPDAPEKWISLDSAAASNGSAESAFTFYYCYQNGQGLDKDEVKAARWKVRVMALRQLGYAVLSTDDIKKQIGLMLDDVTDKIENVILTADPTLYKDKTPAHKVASITVTKFYAHLTKGKVSTIDRSQPFEIEFLVVADPLFMDWNFRVNNIILNGKPQLILSRMSWPQQLYSTQLLPQAQNLLGPDFYVGIHDLAQ
jgi:TPR repeat protein